MKHYVMALTVFAFVVNGLAVTAWAKPCMDHDFFPNIVQNQVDMSEDMTTKNMPQKMPCHDNDMAQDEKRDAPLKHCDNTCFCFHASLNHTPTLADTHDISLPVFYKSTYHMAGIAPYADPHLGSIFRPPIS